MRLETLTYRFELEVIKGDFNIDYNSSLYPKFLDSNSIYTLLRQEDGYELLLSRIKEDRKEGGLFGNYGNCCLIPETKELLLSSSEIRNSSEAENFVCSKFKTYHYSEDRLLREKIENKRKKIQQNPKCTLSIENPQHKEILYLAAISLICGGTIVTNNLKVFNKKIERNLLIEDWTYEKEVICVRDNKPGLLYKVSRLIGENNISIIEAKNQKNRSDKNRDNNFEFVIDVSLDNIPSDIKRRLANVKYKSVENRTKILFNHLRRKDAKNHSNQLVTIKGRDRKNLLADIAYFPFYKKYNILVSNSYLIEDLKEFSIGFVFDMNLSKSEKKCLEDEIYKDINQETIYVESIFFTNSDNTLVS